MRSASKGVKRMWYLATCDNDGRCFGFLNSDDTINKDPDNTPEKLRSFKKKQDANIVAMQINLGHMLLPDGRPYRVAVVKV